ncbi:hypothetical protein [Clostridium sp. BL-8]|uniref:hypothetical protein n=1 Tax=Clostridium sp. BL-8 TaxID=349938 RepID=UPI00098C252C|nr:hypothetical protein [Clostridium sp. BL-8]OOM78643.1 hypothetical protein CLOBL_21760 [Clostridium sp. BL-8]
MRSNLKAFFNVNLSFVPLIFLWSISSQFGIALGFISVIVLLIKEVINKNVGIMSRVLFVYFIIFNICYFCFKIDSVIQYKYLTSYIVLALMGFISIMFGKPYTMYEARSGYDKEFGKSSLFIEVNVVITKIWAVIYLINAIIELAGHNVITIIIMNGLVIIGIILSVVIPSAFPEV